MMRLAPVGKRLAGIGLAFLTFILPLAGCAGVRAPSPDAVATRAEDIPGVTREELDAIQALRERVDGFTFGAVLSSEAYPGDNGRCEGFAALLCRELSGLFGITFTPAIYDWDTLLSGFNDQSIDFTGDMSATKDRLKQYSMTQPIARRTAAVYGESADSLAALAAQRPVRLAFMTASNLFGLVDSALDIPYETSFVVDMDEALVLLEDGIADAFIADRTADAFFVEHGYAPGQPLEPIMYVSVSLATANPALKPIISAADKYLQNGGAAHLNELYNEGMIGYWRHALDASWSDAERKYIEAHSSADAAIVYAAPADDYPASFYSTQSRRYDGLSVALVEQIGILTGLSFRPLDKPPATAAEELACIKDGNAAFICAYVPTKKNTGAIVPSGTGFLNNRMTLLALRDTPEITPYEVTYAKIGLVKHSLPAEYFEDSFVNTKNTIVYNTPEDALEALRLGSVLYVMGTENMLRSAMNFKGKADFAVKYLFDRQVQTYFGYGQKEVVLKSIIDKTLAVLPVFEMSELWMSRINDDGPLMNQQQLPYLAGAIVLLLLGLLAAVTLLIRYAISARRLTQTVRELKDDRALYRHQLQLQADADHASTSDIVSRCRTSLNAVIGTLHKAQRELHDHDKTSIALRSAADTAAALLSHLCETDTLLAAQEGRFQLVFESMRLMAVTEEVAAIMRLRCERVGVIFTYTSTDIDALVVIGDRMHLIQILLNILGNAAKYTLPQNTVDWRVELISEDDETALVRFVVRDNGIGMTQEQLDGLFEFTDASGGLPISQSLVRKMGGRITATSTPGTGSIFQFTLRFSKAEALPDKQQNADVPYDTVPVGKHALVISNPRDATAWIDQLQAHGASADSAPDAEKMIEMFNAAPEDFYQWVLLDTPDAALAARTLRSRSRLDAATIPVIAVLPDGADENAPPIEAYLNAGVSAYADRSRVLSVAAQLLKAARL